MGHGQHPDLKMDMVVHILLPSYLPTAIPVNIVTVDTLGRRLTLCLDYGMAGLGFLLLNICTSRTGTTVFLFLIRASVSGVFNIVYIYTSEVYPTTVRSLGLGTCSGMARLGSMVTPFFAQVRTVWGCFLWFSNQVADNACCLEFIIENMKWYLHFL